MPSTTCATCGGYGRVGYGFFNLRSRQCCACNGQVAVPAPNSPEWLAAHEAWLAEERPSTSGNPTLCNTLEHYTQKSRRFVLPDESQEPQNGDTRVIELTRTPEAKRRFIVEVYYTRESMRSASFGGGPPTPQRRTAWFRATNLGVNGAFETFAAAERAILHPATVVAHYRMDADEKPPEA